MQFSHISDISQPSSLDYPRHYSFVRTRSERAEPSSSFEKVSSATQMPWPKCLHKIRSVFNANIFRYNLNQKVRFAPKIWGWPCPYTLWNLILFLLLINVVGHFILILWKQEIKLGVAEGSANWTEALNTRNFTNFDNISGLPGREVLWKCNSLMFFFFNLWIILNRKR